MVADVRFFVPGLPVPGGSKRGFIVRPKDGAPRVALVDANPKVPLWKQQVANAAAEVWTGMQRAASCATIGWVLSGPLELRLAFVLPRPKAHSRANGSLRDSAPSWHTTKPDATKLLRAVEDALTGVLWADDAQVAVQRVEKRYGHPCGVHVRVRTIEHAINGGIFGEGAEE